MLTRKKWSLGICLAIILALLGVSPPASADSSTPGDGYTAPAPTKLDPAGTDQDQYCIPDVTFLHPTYGFGMYSVNGEVQEGGCHLTNGASSITVTTDFDSGTWTFDYTDEQSGEEAENEYGVVVGDGCKVGPYGDKYTEVTAYFTNVDDATDRYVYRIHPYTISQSEEIARDDDTAYNIADGETVAMRIMIFADELPGLTPGVWVTKFYRSDTGSAGSEGRIVKTIRYTVPRCNGQDPGGTSRRASGHLKRIGCKAVKGRADAHLYTATSRVNYRVVKHVRGHQVHRWNFTVAAGTTRHFWVNKPRRAVTTVALKVKRPNGKWDQLDRVRVPRCH